MRTLMRVCMETERANKAISDGTLPKIVKSFTQEYRPEASYFTTWEGRRTAYFVFDLKDASHIPLIAEPFFMGLNAEIECTPVMNADDLAHGLEAWSKKK